MTALPLEKEEPKKGGRPFGSTTKISKLQRISTRLEQMARTQAMNIIQDSLDGKNVEKTTLDTAKWTVTSAKQFHQAVLAEKEMLAKKDAAKDDAPEVEDEDDSSSGAKFSLHIVETR